MATEPTKASEQPFPRLGTKSSEENQTSPTEANLTTTTTTTTTTEKTATAKERPRAMEEQSNRQEQSSPEGLTTQQGTCMT